MANIDKKTILPALAGAGACLFFQRSGIFSLFFLVPLGFLVYRYQYRAAWFGVLFTVAGNSLFSVWAVFARAYPVVEAVWDILYFSGLACIFVWITAAFPRFSEKLSGAARLIIGSCLGAALSTIVFLRVIVSPSFLQGISTWLDSFLAAYRSSGSNVVQNALLESLNVGMLLDLTKSVMLRGGALFSTVFLFFLSRQVSFGIARFGRKERGGSSLMGFHVHPAMIWVLSVSLLLVVLTGMVKLEIPEMILWNILVLCAILYLAQGCGILQFFFTRSTSPFLRFILPLVFVILLFSPGINAVVLGGVVLLGIAENWAPFRVSRQEGPPSTPEAGGDGN